MPKPKEHETPYHRDQAKLAADLTGIATEYAFGPGRSAMLATPHLQAAATVRVAEATERIAEQLTMLNTQIAAIRRDAASNKADGG